MTTKPTPEWLTDLTDGMERKEELLVGAVDAVVHRANLEPVRKNLAADATGAVVDHKRVFDTVQRVHA